MPTGLVSGVQNSLELRKLELVQFWMGGVGLKVLLIRHREVWLLGLGSFFAPEDLDLVVGGGVELAGDDGDLGGDGI